MGRRETPITSTSETRARVGLALRLREQRQLTGLTYAEMAFRAGYHSTTLQRAASGKKVPRLPVVEAYAKACGASVHQARKLWKAARLEAKGSRLGDRSYRPARPELVRDMADLLPAMIVLYERAGSPPLRELERRAGEHGQLPHSSVHRMLRGDSLPTSREQFTAFIEACGVVARAEKDEWVRAWNRVQASRADLDASDPDGRDSPNGNS